MINSPDGKITEASRALYAVASRAVQHCPAELGQEIALTGSAGWGVADESSDIDLTIWVEEIPPDPAIAGWLQQIGAAHIEPDATAGRETELNMICQLNQIWMEVSFYTVTEYEATLAAILAGEISERTRLIHAWNIVWATPLRTQGRLATWQRKLSTYPDALQERIITTTVSFWRYPHRVEMLWTLARRRALLGLDEWLSADLQDGLRILFAINRQWEPDWKNLDAASRLLTSTPKELVPRVNAILSAMDPERRVALAQQLILDILELVPSQYDVTEPVANMRASLQKHASLSDDLPSYVPYPAAPPGQS